MRSAGNGDRGPGRCWVRPIAVTAVVVLGAAGCGDDDDEGATAEACDAFIAADEAAINDDLDGAIAAIERFVEAAPEDVAAEVAPVIPLLREDPEAADQSEEMAVANAASDRFALDNCADSEVDVQAVNFAFPEVPTTVDGGRVAFVLENRTQTDEFHEALLLRRHDDVEGSPHDVLAAAIDGQPLSVDTTLGALASFDFVGAGLVEPGGGDVFVADLAPGEYVIACLLPVESATTLEPYFVGETVDGGVYHFQQGMYAEFTVE